MPQKRKKMTKRRSRGGASYLCPECEAPSHVVITRRDEDKNVRRVRSCAQCGNKFQTVETEQ